MLEVVHKSLYLQYSTVLTVCRVSLLTSALCTHILCTVLYCAVQYCKFFEVWDGITHWLLGVPFWRGGCCRALPCCSGGLPLVHRSTRHRGSTTVRCQRGLSSEQECNEVLTTL